MEPVLTSLDARSGVEVKDLVMGLHWAPAPEHERRRWLPADLDAICVLVDAQHRWLDMVCPGRIANVNGSVMHTGDSLTGASPWDDERVFVFLDALPEAVHALLFGVLSSNGRPFCDVAGASCHVSDYRSEDELLRVELTALGSLTEYCVATVERSASGWTMRAGSPPATSLTELLSVQSLTWGTNESDRFKAAACAGQERESI